MAAKSKDELETHQGKQPNQKLKPYLVLQYLLKNTDENHTTTSYDIVEYLENIGICAERRSIYKDIEEINKAILMTEEHCTIQEAEEMLVDDEDGELKLIVYDKKRKGFYVRQQHYDLNDIRLLAECIYSAKFLPQSQSERLTDVVCEFVSIHQAKQIKHDAYLTDRVRTQNKSVLTNISLINDAMSTERDGAPHTPEKIEFQYLTYSIQNTSQQIARRHGERFSVSPYKLLINDSNYYLLAFDSRSHKMKTYRVDRMKNINFTNQPREGEAAFKEINLRTYTKRVFSMFSGKEERVIIRFINPLLDVVIDRFGKQSIDTQYEAIDETHFTITTQVEISDQFFGWLLGFGRKAKLLGSETVLKQFKAYLIKINDLYKEK